jgi:hypothetical protein
MELLVEEYGEDYFSFELKGDWDYGKEKEKIRYRYSR